MTYMDLILMNTSIVVGGRRFYFDFDENKDGTLLVKLDLHGMRKNEAKYVINGIISMYNFEFTMMLIHGYSNGTVIKDMIQYDIHNKRIVAKSVYMHNKGVTYLFVNSKE